MTAALLETVVKERNGTLAVPMFTMAGGMADTVRSGVVFDVLNTPSGTGRITEMVRQSPGAVRSLHPTPSVAALGPRAQWLTEAHHLDSHSFGAVSPLGRLIEADGFVLGIGVDLGPVTFFHTVEDSGDFPFTVYTTNSPLPAVCRDKDGRDIDVKVMVHDPAASGTRSDRPKRRGDPVIPDHRAGNLRRPPMVQAGRWPHVAGVGAALLRLHRATREAAHHSLCLRR